MEIGNGPFVRKLIESIIDIVLIILNGVASIVEIGNEPFVRKLTLKALFL